MKTTSTRRRCPNKFIRVITIPFRALCKAREFYVRTMMDCTSSHVAGLQGPTPPQAQRRSLSLSSPRSSDTNEEDYRELIRAASARNVVGRISVDAYLRQEMHVRSASSSPAMARRSPMGPIDEERPCCYTEEDHVRGGNKMNVGARSESKSPIRNICNAVRRMTF